MHTYSYAMPLLALAESLQFDLSVSVRFPQLCLPAATTTALKICLAFSAYAHSWKVLSSANRCLRLSLLASWPMLAMKRPQPVAPLSGRNWMPQRANDPWRRHCAATSARAELLTGRATVADVLNVLYVLGDVALDRRYPAPAAECAPCGMQGTSGTRPTRQH